MTGIDMHSVVALLEDLPEEAEQLMRLHHEPVHQAA